MVETFEEKEIESLFLFDGESVKEIKIKEVAVERTGNRSKSFVSVFRKKIKLIDSKNRTIKIHTRRFCTLNYEEYVYLTKQNNTAGELLKKIETEINK